MVWGPAVLSPLLFVDLNSSSALMINYLFSFVLFFTFFLCFHLFLTIYGLALGHLTIFFKEYHTIESTKIRISSFISGRRDSLIRLLHGRPACTLEKVQRVEKSAAQLCLQVCIDSKLKVEQRLVVEFCKVILPNSAISLYLNSKEDTNDLVVKVAELSMGNGSFSLFDRYIASADAYSSQKLL